MPLEKNKGAFLTTLLSLSVLEFLSLGNLKDKMITYYYNMQLSTTTRFELQVFPKYFPHL